MEQRPLNVIVVAEEAAGARALRLVGDAGHRLSAVLTAAGTDSPVAAAATGLDVPILSAELLRDPGFARRLHEERVDLLLNVHSLVVADAAVVAAPAIGSFNLHPGPLPEYAGLNAPSWAIFEGAAAYASTLHWMDANVDAGPVAYTASVAVAPDETGLSLTTKCIHAGLPLVAKLIAAAAAAPASIPALDQDLERRRYLHRGPPSAGVLDWSWPAAAIERFVRACDFHPFASPWGSPRTWLWEQKVGIMRARATDCATQAPPGTVATTNEGAVAVAARDAWVEVALVLVDGRPLEARNVLKPGAVLGASFS